MRESLQARAERVRAEALKRAEKQTGPSRAAPPSRLSAAPSPYWLDEARARRTKLPPPADHTPMVRCESDNRQCNGRYNPAYYVVADRPRRDQPDADPVCRCEDCREAQFLELLQSIDRLENTEGPLPSKRLISNQISYEGRGAALIEELAEEHHNAVLDDLRKLGLTDREIAVLSESHQVPRPTQRDIATKLAISQTTVCLCLTSAMNKLAKTDFKLPPPVERERPSVILMDPDELDRMTA
jgi:hypothetical protein